MHAYLSFSASVCILVIIAIGCSGLESTGAWSPKEGYSPTANDMKAVDVARVQLEQQSSDTCDYRYKVDRHNGDYWVYIDFIYGYHASGDAVMVPGGHCTVVVSPELKVKEFFPGA